MRSAAFDRVLARYAVEPWTPLLVRLISNQRPRPAGRAPL